MSKTIKFQPVQRAALAEDYFCRLTETPEQEARRQARRSRDAAQQEGTAALSTFLSCLAICAATILVCFLAAL